MAEVLDIEQKGLAAASPTWSSSLIMSRLGAGPIAPHVFEAIAESVGEPVQKALWFRPQWLEETSEWISRRF